MFLNLKWIVIKNNKFYIKNNINIKYTFFGFYLTNNYKILCIYILILHKLHIRHFYDWCVERPNMPQ